MANTLLYAYLVCLSCYCLKPFYYVSANGKPDGLKEGCHHRNYAGNLHKALTLSIRSIYSANVIAVDRIKKRDQRWTSGNRTTRYGENREKKNRDSLTSPPVDTALAMFPCFSVCTEKSSTNRLVGDWTRFAQDATAGGDGWTRQPGR